MTREKVEALMDKVINKFGFEDDKTIQFCECCECYLGGNILTCDFEIEVDDFFFCNGMEW